jgi:hypothetical protein
MNRCLFLWFNGKFERDRNCFSHFLFISERGSSFTRNVSRIFRSPLRNAAAFLFRINTRGLRTENYKIICNTQIKKLKFFLCRINQANYKRISFPPLNSANVTEERWSRFLWLRTGCVAIAAAASSLSGGSTHSAMSIWHRLLCGCIVFIITWSKHSSP